MHIHITNMTDGGFGSVIKTDVPIGVEVKVEMDGYHNVISVNNQKMCFSFSYYAPANSRELYELEEGMAWGKLVFENAEPHISFDWSMNNSLDLELEIDDESNIDGIMFLSHQYSIQNRLCTERKQIKLSLIEDNLWRIEQ